MRAQDPRAPHQLQSRRCKSLSQTCHQHGEDHYCTCGRRLQPLGVPADRHIRLLELGIANNLAKAGEILITPSAWKLIRNDSIAEPMEFELKDAIAQGGRLNGLNKPSSIFSSK